MKTWMFRILTNCVITWAQREGRSNLSTHYQTMTPISMNLLFAGYNQMAPFPISLRTIFVPATMACIFAKAAQRAV
jgi:DNA-directed RNA polymerase specialized sigma24 family protein